MVTGYRLKPATKGMIALAVLLFAAAFCASPWGRAWDQFVGDMLFTLRGPVETPSEIVIVAVDEPSFGTIEKQWPWPRSLHARLIDSLFAAGARAVVFDIIFAEASDPEEDRELRAALERHPPVALASEINEISEKHYFQEILVSPHADVLGPLTSTGIANVPLDTDGVVRRLPHSREGLPSLAMKAASLYCLDAACPGFAAGEDPAADRREINFPGPQRTVETVSYYQALDPGRFLRAGIFNGKLVFVGLSLGSSIMGKGKGSDNFPIPFSRWGYTYMAGVEIHASAALNFIRGNSLQRIPQLPAILAALAAGGLTAVLFLRVRPAAAGIFWAAILAAGFGISFWAFTAKAFRLPFPYFFVCVSATFLVSPFVHYWQVWKEKSFIRRAFATYLAPAVVNELIRDPEKLSLGGKMVEATALFLDIVGFTTLSERTHPKELVQVVNRYLGEFSDVVIRREGMLDKYMGDALMATWGAAVHQPDHAFRACGAALEILETLGRLTEEEQQLGTGVHLRVRIGINSGRMIAGNVGGTKHFSYTVLGDNVNLASRLEGVNKAYGTVVMIGQNTAEFVGEAFELREIDLVNVKGKHEPIRIFELQGEKGCLDEGRCLLNRHFAEARTLYVGRRWKEAAHAFEHAVTVCGTDGPCLTFLERCLQFDGSPPAPDWNGSVSLEK